MINKFIERFNDYKKKNVRRSPLNYFFFMFHYLYIIIRMASYSNVILLTMLTISNLITLTDTIKYQLESPYSSEPDPDFQEIMNTLQHKVTQENVDKTIYTLIFHFGFVGNCFLANVCLLKATYKPFLIRRRLHNIFVWLLVHTIHVIYSFFFNIWIRIFNSSNNFTLISISNTITNIGITCLVSWFIIRNHYIYFRKQRLAIID